MFNVVLRSTKLKDLKRRSNPVLTTQDMTLVLHSAQVHIVHGPWATELCLDEYRLWMYVPIR